MYTFFNCPPNVWRITANQRWEWESYSLPCYCIGNPVCILGLTVLIPKGTPVLLFRCQHRLSSWYRALEAKTKEYPAKYSEIWGLSKNLLIVVWARKLSLHRYWQISKYHFHQTCGRWPPWWQWLELKTGKTVHLQMEFFKGHTSGQGFECVETGTRNMWKMDQQFWGPGKTCKKVAALHFGKSYDNIHDFTTSAKV